LSLPLILLRGGPLDRPSFPNAFEDGETKMTRLNTRAVALGLATALVLALPHCTARAIAAGNLQESMDGDRAPYLYMGKLPGTLGCIDDTYSRVTWGCD
jgi:hypothetical protein